MTPGFGNPARRNRRPPFAGGVLLALVVAGLISLPGIARGQVLLNADFNADTVGAPPNQSPAGAPAGDSITMNGVQGGDSILVQGPAGGFINNSVRIFHPQGFGNAPAVVATPVPGSYTSGFFFIT